MRKLTVICILCSVFIVGTVIKLKESRWSYGDSFALLGFFSHTRTVKRDTIVCWTNAQTSVNHEQKRQQQETYGTTPMIFLINEMGKQSYRLYEFFGKIYLLSESQIHR